MTFKPPDSDDYQNAAGSRRRTKTQQGGMGMVKRLQITGHDGAKYAARYRGYQQRVSHG